MSSNQSLIVHPTKGQDEVLNFALKCALQIKNSLKSCGLKYVHLKGPSATNHHVKNQLVTMNGGNFLAFGHGSPELLTITGGSPIFTISDAPYTVDKVCYFVSCCTAQKIGPETIRHGAIAFIGFLGQFFVPKYHKDDLINCITAGITCYLLGKCALDEIEKITDDAFYDLEKKLTSNGDLISAANVAHNRNEMVFLLK